MSIIRFIGDVHGKFRRYSAILDHSPHPTLQVGDMGVGFRRFPHGEPSQNPPFDKMVAGNHRFIRGNHDNPNACRAHKQWIGDGKIDGNVMFIGGALSIDKAFRIEDYSYWSNEELPQDELDAMVRRYDLVHPKIMITHECPESMATHVAALAGVSKLDPRFASRTRMAFEQMLARHKPKLWIFGHWHVPFDYIHEGCRFICLPELNWCDVNTETCEVQKMPPAQPFERPADMKPMDNNF